MMADKTCFNAFVMLLHILLRTVCHPYFYPEILLSYVCLVYKEAVCCYCEVFTRYSLVAVVLNRL